jgi:uroporphyrinogen decarboxylase
MDAVAEIRRALDNSVPLIGFSGSPWTLACYMVEGGGSDDYRRVKTMLYDRPDLMHRILQVTAESVVGYLNAQIDSGAQAVMIFDSWGGALSHAAYREFSLAYMQQIVAGLKREKDGQRVPCIVFTKGGGQWIEAIADIGCDAIGLDWTTDLGEARRRVGNRVALQGNMDPVSLFASPDKVAAEARRVLDSYGGDDGDGLAGGHVFNLGHGISQFTPPDHVTALVDAVHSHSRRGSTPA